MSWGLLSGELLSVHRGSCDERVSLRNPVVMVAETQHSERSREHPVCNHATPPCELYWLQSYD